MLTIFFNEYFYELFDDLMIILAFLFISGFHFRENPINKKSKFFKKYFFGVIGGLVGFTIIINTVEVGIDKAVVDLRYLVLILIFYFGGIYPTLITSGLLIFTQIILYDISHGALTCIFSLIILIIVLLVIDHKIDKKRKKLFYYLFQSAFIYFVTYSYLLGQDKRTYHILFSFLLIAIVSSFIIYYLVDYIETSNEMYEKYKENSCKDYLTGLYNTRQYDKEVNKIYNRLIHTNEQLALFILDLDYFKKVNDDYGHIVGDEVLSQFAQILNRIVRKDDQLFRIGGEEFSLLSMNMNQQEALSLGEEIRKTIEETSFLVNNLNIHITVSIGIAIFPETVMNIQTLKESADKALYNSKSNGRNQVSIV